MGGCPPGQSSQICQRTISQDSGYWSTGSATYYKDFGYVYRIIDGLSSSTFTSCTREQTNSIKPGGWPCNGQSDRTTTDPNNVGSTFFGIKADLPTTSLTGSNYNIWQAMDVERAIAVITYNGSAFGAPSAFDFTATGPDVGEVVVDSENCVYGIARTNTNHVKIYPLANNTTFPNGGNCVWPVSASFLNNGKNFFNDPYVEYVLTRETRDPLFCQITASSFDDEKRDLARQWVASNGETFTGTKVYPNYTTATVVGGYRYSYIPRIEVNESFHPCSDETGTGYILSRGSYYSRPAFIHPDYIEPNLELLLTPNNATPILQDSGFWNDQMLSTTVSGASGYDDLSVRYLASAINDHTFELISYDFDTGDRVNDICGDSKCNCGDSYPQCGTNIGHITGIQTNSTTYRYHDPSQSGKPGSRWNGAPGEVNGTYTSDATAFTYPNPYLISGASPYAGTNYPIFTPQKTVTVWERWPTAKFYINPVNLNAMRDNWYGTTAWIRHDNPGAIDNGLSLYDENRICSGMAPLSADITDVSIGRTWPISSWYLDLKADESAYSSYFYILCGAPYYYDTNSYPPSSEVRSGNTIVYTTSTATITTTDPNFHHRDSSSEIHNLFAKHVYFEPGTYNLTLYTEASNTGTESAAISTGITDIHILSGFTKYATRTLIVKEACPWANFITISAMTVPSDYTDEYGSVTATPICAAYIDTAYHGRFISGYAPNLTITWMDSSVARSYPLCSYEWNFGDYYDELRNISSVSVNTLYTSYPTWFSDKTNHYVSHTYAMPGIYNVDLDLRVSGTGTGACEVCSKELHVYVQEIPLQPCFTYSNVASSGYGTIPITGMVAPATIYVNASCIIPGSFPICRIDWDFGDGSDVFTVSRNMSSVSPIAITAYPMDPYDPRNYIVSHEYERKSSGDLDTFSITMTAYACNTNSYLITAHAGALSALELPPYNINISDDTPLHLVGNRNFGIDNNTMLVFEGRKGYTLNYVLSTGE